MRNKSDNFFVKSVILIISVSLLIISCQRRDEKVASNIISKINSEKFQEVYENSSDSLTKNYTEEEFTEKMKEILAITGEISSIEIYEPMELLVPEPESDKITWQTVYKIYSENGEFTAIMSFDNSDGNPKLSFLGISKDSKWYGMNFE